MRNRWPFKCKRILKDCKTFRVKKISGQAGDFFYDVIIYFITMFSAHHSSIQFDFIIRDPKILLVKISDGRNRSAPGTCYRYIQYYPFVKIVKIVKM